MRVSVHRVHNLFCPGRRGDFFLFHLFWSFHESGFVFCIFHLKYLREDPKLDWATLIQTDRQQVWKNLITRQYDSPFQIPIVLPHRWERLGLSIWFNTYDNHCDRTAEKHCWGVQRPGEKSQRWAHGRADEKGLAVLCVCVEMRRRCQSNDDILEQEMGLIKPLCASLQAKISRSAFSSPS